MPLQRRPLAVVQFAPRRGACAANLAALGSLVKSALRAGAELVVCPEMAVSGYRFPDRAAIATSCEHAHDGPTRTALQTLANTHQASIVVGIAEAANDGQLFNTALVIRPDTSPASPPLIVYRKRLLYDDDRTWATAGLTPYPLWPTSWGTATLGICMDLNSDEFTTHVRTCQPAVVAFPTNWIDEGLDIHTYWRWRLAGWAGVLAAADRWGHEDGVDFWGRSCVMIAGRVVAAAPPRGDGLLLWPPDR